MFGRVRAASSWALLESLERPASKILKDDSLSIYETILMELKLGSQCNLSLPHDWAMEMENDSGTAGASSSSMESNTTSTTALKNSQNVNPLADEEVIMAIDSDPPSDNDKSSFSVTQSTVDSKRQHSRNVSVLYLFSKYSNSRQALAPCGETVMLPTSNSSASICASSCTL